MYAQRAQELVSIAISVILNLSFAGVFLSALLFPLVNVNFVRWSAGLFMLLELYSILMTRTKQHRFLFQKNRPGAEWIIFLGYGLFLLCAGVLIHWSLPIIILIRLGVQQFAKKNNVEEPRVLIPLGLWFLAILIALYASSLLVHLFPIPSAFFESDPEWLKREKPEDYPQVELMWGILYFTFIALAEIFLFWRRSLGLIRK